MSKFIIWSIAIYLKGMVEDHGIPQANTHQFLSKFLKIMDPWKKAKITLSLLEKIISDIFRDAMQKTGNI